MPDTDDGDTTVHISAELAVDLPLSDIYPDGIPDGWTTQGILDTIRESRSLSRWISEWCLSDDAMLTVAVTGEPTVHGGFR